MENATLSLRPRSLIISEY